MNLYHSSLILFHQYLRITHEMSVSFSDKDRKNANALLGNLFRHDISKVIKIGFYLINHYEILERLIMVTHVFFKLLHDYARGKVLTAQTNRIKKKKKGKKEKTGKAEELEGVEGFGGEEE